MLLETYSELSRVLTPNATTPYAFTWLNLEQNGPYVVEVPIGPTAGVVDDLWQRRVGPGNCTPSLSQIRT